MKYKLLTSSLLGALAAATLWLGPAWANLDDNLRHTPAGADVFVAVNTDQKDWDYFLKRKPFSTMYQDLLKEILPAFGKEMGIDAEKELLPLFGSHITAAVYHTSISQKKFPALIAVDLSNPSQFQPVLDKLKAAMSKDQEKPRTLLESNYKGIQVYGVAKKGETGSEIYMALSGNTLLFGNQTLMQAAIDAAQSSQNLAQDAVFAKTLKSLRSEKLWFYMNPRHLDAYLNLIPDTPEQEAQAAIREIKKSFELYNSFGLGLDLNSRGLRFKSFATFQQGGPDSLQKKYLREIEKAIRNPQAPLSTVLRAAPERPLFFAAAQGFHLIPSGLKLFMGDHLKLFMGDQPETKEILDELIYKGFKSWTQLDMDKDILAHSDGRVGMSLFYPKNLKTVTQPPHAVIYLGVKNNEKFLKTLHQKLMLDFSAMQPSKAKKKQASTITFPKTPQARYRGAPLYMSNLTPTAQGLKKEMGIQAGYTYVNNLWFFGSNIEALKAAIDYAHSAKASLLDNHYFMALREKYALQENAGTFFVDLSKIVDLVELFMGEDEEIKSLLPTLGAFKSMLAGGAYRDGGAEGVFLLDVDMDQIDFELLGKILGESDGAKDKALEPPIEEPDPAQF